MTGRGGALAPTAQRKKRRRRRVKLISRRSFAGRLKPDLVGVAGSVETAPTHRESLGSTDGCRGPFRCRQSHSRTRTPAPELVEPRRGPAAARAQSSDPPQNRFLLIYERRPNEGGAQDGCGDLVLARQEPGLPARRRQSQFGAWRRCPAWVAIQKDGVSYREEVYGRAGRLKAVDVGKYRPAQRPRGLRRRRAPPPQFDAAWKGRWRSPPTPTRTTRRPRPPMTKTTSFSAL